MVVSKVGLRNNTDVPIDTICVCGAARSGTSMIAGILRILGVDMGEGHMDVDTNEDRRFLCHEGDREIFSDAARKSGYLGRIAPLVAQHASRPLSGWKDPLSSYYVADVARELPGLGVVFVARDPVSVALGELRFRESVSLDADFQAFTGGMDFVNREYRLVSEFASTFEGRSLFVSYEKALLHKEQLLHDISSFVGVAIDDGLRRALMSYISPEANTGVIAAA